MATITTTKLNNQSLYVKELERKSSLLDELLELIEDKYLGYLMEQTEEEENIPLSKAKKYFK